MAPNPTATSPCVCDCGYSGASCSTTNFINPTCENPATNVTGTFLPTLNPQNNATFCLDSNGNHVTCWCPQDTCTVSSQGLALCHNGWTGFGWNTTRANAHEYLQCGELYRTTVCSGHGSQPSFLATYSPLAAVTNPPGPCTCDVQWWDTTYSDGRIQRCNFQSNCSSSTRFGFQHIPCSGHGTCQRNSSCICTPGWAGPACDQNTLCPSTSPNLECSGQGTCSVYQTQFDPMTYAVWGNTGAPGANGPQNYSATGNTAPASAVAGKGTAFLFKLNFFAIPQPTQILTLPIAAIASQCYKGQTVGGPIGCYRSMLAYLFNATLGQQWQTFLASNGYTNNLQQFVQDAFLVYYPMLGPIDPSWITPVSALLASTNHVVQAEGLALLLSYTMFTDFTRPDEGYPCPYPTFPQHVCQCNGGVFPAQSSPTGKDCSVSCPFNANYFGEVCSGTFQGLTAGSCNTGSGNCNVGAGQCCCNPQFVTALSHGAPVNGCNLNLETFCVLHSRILRTSSGKLRCCFCERQFSSWRVCVCIWMEWTILCQLCVYQHNCYVRQQRCLQWRDQTMRLQFHPERAQPNDHQSSAALGWHQLFVQCHYAMRPFRSHSWWSGYGCLDDV